MNRNREKRKRQNDEIRDIAIKPIVKKAKKIDTMSVIKEDYDRKPKPSTHSSGFHMIFFQTHEI